MEAFNSILTSIIFLGAIFLFSSIKSLILPSDPDNRNLKFSGISILVALIMIFGSYAIKDHFIAKNIEPSVHLFEKLYVASKTDVVGDYNQELAEYVKVGTITKDQAQNLIDKYSGLVKQDENFFKIILPEPDLGSPLVKTSLLFAATVPSLLYMMGGLAILMSILLVYIKKRNAEEDNLDADKPIKVKLSFKDFKITYFLTAVLSTSFFVIPSLSNLEGKEVLQLINFGKTHPEYVLYNETLHKITTNSDKISASEYQTLSEKLDDDKKRIYKELLDLN